VGRSSNRFLNSDGLNVNDQTGRPRKLSNKITDIHRKMIRAAKRYYEGKGWIVHADSAHKNLALHSHRIAASEIGQPDLVLEKNGEIAVVEVTINPGEGKRFFRQLMRYRRAGRVFLLFPIDVSGIQLDGVDQELEQQIWGQ